MLRTFRIGGIHPPENKLSAGKKITALATPKQVIIPLSQHIGAPAQAVVKKGGSGKGGYIASQGGWFRISEHPLFRIRQSEQDR